MARNQFRPVPIPTSAGARVRFDTASGSNTPADVTPIGSGTSIAGAVVRSDPNGGILPAILGPDFVTTLYQKTLDAAGAPTGETFTLTSPNETSGVPATTRNVAGGRSVIATRLGTGGTLQSAQNVPLGTSVKHTAVCDAADIRLGYGIVGTTAGPNQPLNLKVGLSYAGVTHRVTWTGRQKAIIEPYGLVALSDPVGIEVKKGDVFYTRPFQNTDWGYTPLAAAVSAGATSFTTNNRPGALSGLVTVESTREVVEVAYWEGTGAPPTAAPYTCYLKAGTTFAGAHASGAVAGGTVYANFGVRGDLGDYNVISSTDNSWTTTSFAFNGSALSTTLTQAVAIGDTVIKVANPTNIGPTCTVDGEVLTIRNVYGSASPYTVQLVSPATATHSSGATVTGSITVGLGLAPILIVADRVGTNRRGTVIVIGDSIPNGVGNYLTQGSYAIGPNGALEEAGFAVVNTALSGEAMFQYVDKTVSGSRRALYSMAEWALFTYGVNDAYSSRTGAQMIADATAILGDIRSRGVKTIVCTLPPRTTSTDGWTTVGGQTTVGAGTFAAAVTIYNNWVRGGAGGLADRVCELADAVMTARNSQIWKADALGPYTIDGTHPTWTGNQLLMKPALAAVLGTVTI